MEVRNRRIPYKWFRSVFSVCSVVNVFGLNNPRQRSRMTTRAQTLADSVLLSRELLRRYLAGFDDTNHTKQPPDMPNHVAWTLGHLALTMHRAAEKIDDTPPPESDFFKGSGRGDSHRFDTEAVCFGSKPGCDPATFPPMKRCVNIFSGAIDRLAATVGSADDAALDKLVKWGALDVPAWAAVARMVFHNGTHCGQIADLRRALRMNSVFA